MLHSLFPVAIFVLLIDRGSGCGELEAVLFIWRGPVTLTTPLRFFNSKPDLSKNLETITKKET